MAGAVIGGWIFNLLGIYPGLGIIGSILVAFGGACILLWLVRLSGNVAAFSGATIEFAKRIAEASTLTFQFTPFDGSPQVVRFDVRGLDPHLHKLAEACGWAY